MSTVVFNGQVIDLGEAGDVRFSYHCSTADQAAAAVREMGKVIANEDVDWEPKFSAGNTTVWLSQEIDLDDGRSKLGFTIFLPKEVVEVQDSQALYVGRAKAFVDSVNGDDVTDHSALHEEAERERLDAEYYGPDWDGQS